MIRLLHSEVEVEAIIDALRSSKGDRGPTNFEIALAVDIEQQLESERKSRAARAAADAATAELRARRARDHVLTVRQAECLLAIREGRSAYHAYRPSRKSAHLYGPWESTRNTGGAVRRMVEELIEEGLLDDHRRLTDAGRERLAGYIEAHAKFPVPT